MLKSALKLDSTLLNNLPPVQREVALRNVKDYSIAFNFRNRLHLDVGSSGDT